MIDLNITEKNWLLTTTEIKILSHDEVMQSSFGKLKTIASNNDPMQQKDLMYIEFILCHEGPNGNGDYFSQEELENSYYSAVHKVYNWEHNTPIIGTITDAILVKPPIGESDSRWRVECAAVVWKWLFPTYAESIKEGALDGSRRNSMEAYFSDYVYVVGNQVYTRDEKPELEQYINKSYGGVPVYRGLKGTIFGGAGCVEKPADKGAVFKSVAAQRFTDAVQIRDINLDNVTLDDVEEEVRGLEGINKVVADEAINLENQNEGVVDNAVAPEGHQEHPLQEGNEHIDEGGEDTECTPAGSENADDNKVEGEDVAVEDSVEDLTGDSAHEDLVQGEESHSVGDTEQLLDANAAHVNEILNRWAITQNFWNSFSALECAIEGVLWDGESEGDKEKVKAKITEEVQAFADVIFSLLPSLLGFYYDSSATKASQDVEIEQATIEIENLKLQLQTVKDEYDTFKEQIESAKRSAQLEELAQKRVQDLLNAGLKFSEEKLKTICERVKSQTEEEYLEFKDLLVEARYASASEHKHESTDGADGEVDAGLAGATLALLNIESEPTKSLEEQFSDLIKNMKSFK